MKERKRIIILILIMVLLLTFVESITIALLYRTALEEDKSRLEETAKSQAALIEAVARFDAKYSNNYPGGSHDATLSQIIDAHKHYKGFGRTGEFTLSKPEDGKIVFLLRHRHGTQEEPKPIPFHSILATPMQLALSGKSGTMIGRDYRNVKVLAAYEPVKEMGWGIVAKIDLSEIQAPFIKAAVLSGIIGTILSAIGTYLFIHVTNPIIDKLTKTIESLQNTHAKVKHLHGLLPICARCKKIRDDNGYWNQIESYIKNHSEAEFSHGLCPDCAKKQYAELESDSAEIST